MSLGFLQKLYSFEGFFTIMCKHRKSLKTIFLNVQMFIGAQAVNMKV